VRRVDGDPRSLSSGALSIESVFAHFGHPVSTLVIAAVSVVLPCGRRDRSCRRLRRLVAFKRLFSHIVFFYLFNLIFLAGRKLTEP